MLYFLHGDSAVIEIEYQNVLTEINSRHPEQLKQYFFDAVLKEVDSFLEKISINSIFGDKEILVLKRAHHIKTSGVTTLFKAIKKYNLNLKEIIILFEEVSNFGKTLPEYAITKTLSKLVSETGNDIDCSLSTRNARIKEHIQTNLNTSDYESEKLIEILGTDIHRINHEIQKIKNYLDGEKFDISKVVDILTIDKEYNLFLLIEEFLKKKDSQNLLDFLLKNDSEYNSFVYLMGDELTLILKLKLLESKGEINSSYSYNNFNAVYENYKLNFLNRLGRPLHPYQVFLKIQYLKLFSVDFLKNKIKQLLYCEYHFKSSYMDMKISIEKFLVAFFVS